MPERSSTASLPCYLSLLHPLGPAAHSELTTGSTAMIQGYGREIIKPVWRSDRPCWLSVVRCGKDAMIGWAIPIGDPSIQCSWVPLRRVSEKQFFTGSDRSTGTIPMPGSSHQIIKVFPAAKSRISRQWSRHSSLSINTTIRLSGHWQSCQSTMESRA